MSKDLSQEIHDKAAPFLVWLKEAEEEESESDEKDDDDDDLEVGISISIIFDYFGLAYETVNFLSERTCRANGLARTNI